MSLRKFCEQLCYRSPRVGQYLRPADEVVLVCYRIVEPPTKSWPVRGRADYESLVGDGYASAEDYSFLARIYQ